MFYRWNIVKETDMSIYVFMKKKEMFCLKFKQVRNLVFFILNANPGIFR